MKISVILGVLALEIDGKEVNNMEIFRVSKVT
jgi:hypothetical protein